MRRDPTTDPQARLDFSPFREWNDNDFDVLARRRIVEHKTSIGTPPDASPTLQHDRAKSPSWKAMSQARNMVFSDDCLREYRLQFEARRIEACKATKDKRTR